MNGDAISVSKTLNNVKKEYSKTQNPRRDWRGRGMRRIFLIAEACVIEHIVVTGTTQICGPEIRLNISAAIHICIVKC
jgi:hypothetical protein